MFLSFYLDGSQEIVTCDFSFEKVICFSGFKYLKSTMRDNMVHRGKLKEVVSLYEMCRTSQLTVNDDPFSQPAGKFPSFVRAGAITEQSTMEAGSIDILT